MCICIGTNYSINVPLKDGIDDNSYANVFKPVIQGVMDYYRYICMCVCVCMCTCNAFAGVFIYILCIYMYMCLQMYAYTVLQCGAYSSVIHHMCTHLAYI